MLESLMLLVLPGGPGREGVFYKGVIMSGCGCGCGSHKGKDKEKEKPVQKPTPKGK
jgi:hypothetical protein